MLEKANSSHVFLIRLRKQIPIICAGLLLVGLASACMSNKVMIVAQPHAYAQKLGRVEGTAVGSIFQAIIPIGENSRTARAYKNALAKAPGATALTDVTLQEDWYWYYLGTLRVVIISGEAVK